MEGPGEKRPSRPPCVERGVTDDVADIAVVSRRTAAQQLNILELMLGQSANCCPLLSRNTMVLNYSPSNQYGKPSGFTTASSQHVVTSSILQASAFIPTRNAKIWSLLWKTIFSQLTVIYPITANSPLKTKTCQRLWRISLC